ncbi:hypothetical protein [Phyllobacterium lublinensis]|uniref:hypothetical protein n=1 Tax=Phyllobacterium lublinensis TaxID=2875708 RepID=UPI001CC9B87C|nr:hypothetical protein [Phyllobacterium sp. 2063]MBZ9653542.1 hypothetical protein [Phyllobacterium sp. 2063]
MRIDLGTHWHGDHAKPLRNPHQATAAIWIECTDRQASRLVDAGASVTNCSPVSALSAYPKMGLEQWLLAQTWHANRIGKVTNGKKN